MLTGLSIPQEYCCVDATSFTRKLKVLILSGDGPELDVTSRQIFLGYKPLILGFGFGSQEPIPEIFKTKGDIRLRFVDELNDRQKRLAALDLAYVNKYDMPDGTCLFIFEGLHGAHKFLNIFHQWVNHVRQRLRKSRAGNIALPGNLLEQVVIAYSMPRIISVITVNDGAHTNMFPTDLHGKIGEGFYTGSLREKGFAHEQVSKLKRIVISEMSPDRYREVYALGKNHMRELTTTNAFQVANERSAVFGFPLPEGFVRYRELTSIGIVNHGIHCIHIYTIDSEHSNGDLPGTLAHLHGYYIQWRSDQGIPTSWLKR